MQKIIPRILKSKILKSHFSLSFFSTTASNSFRSLSFQEHFDAQFDKQISKQEFSLDRSESSKIDIQHFLSFAEDVPQETIDLNKLRQYLTYLCYGIEDSKVPKIQLPKIAMNLQKQSLLLLKEQPNYDHTILKLLYSLAKENILPLNDLIETIYELANTPSFLQKISIENFTNILLIFNDVNKLPAFKGYSDPRIRETIKLLAKQTEVYLHDKNLAELQFSFCLPKILFCFTQFQMKDRNLLNKLLTNILSYDISKLGEMEITSLLYTSIKMEKKLNILSEETKSSFSQEFQNLYTQLLEIIVKRANTKLLSYTRVPYIMYCIAMIGSYSKLAVDSLMRLFLTNLENYNVSEVCTVMYCMWKLPAIDSNHQYLMKIVNLYFDSSKGNLEQLFDTNLYTAFLGIRKPLQSKLESSQREKLQEFLQNLLSVFKKKFSLLTDESIIRILYEVTHVQKLVERREFLEIFTPRILEIELVSLNNHDFITVGFLMKKYFHFKHFDFWDQYLKILASRKWNKNLEKERVNMIFTNLNDFINKKEAVEPRDERNKKRWQSMVETHYNAFVSKNTTTTGLNNNQN